MLVADSLDRSSKARGGYPGGTWWHGAAVLKSVVLHFHQQAHEGKSNMTISKSTNM